MRSHSSSGLYCYGEDRGAEIIIILACCTALRSAEVSMKSGVLSADRLMWHFTIIKAFVSRLGEPTTAHPQSVQGFRRINFTYNKAGCDLDQELLDAESNDRRNISHGALNACNAELDMSLIFLWKAVLFNNLVSLRITDLKSAEDGSFAKLVTECCTLRSFEVSFNKHAVSHDNAYFDFLWQLRAYGRNLRRLSIEGWKTKQLEPDSTVAHLKSLQELTYLRLPNAMVFGDDVLRRPAPQSGYLLEFLPTSLEELHIYPSGQLEYYNDFVTLDVLDMMEAAPFPFHKLRTISLTVQATEGDAFELWADAADWSLEGRPKQVPYSGVEMRLVRDDRRTLDDEVAEV